MKFLKNYYFVSLVVVSINCTGFAEYDRHKITGFRSTTGIDCTMPTDFGYATKKESCYVIRIPGAVGNKWERRNCTALINSNRIWINAAGNGVLITQKDWSKDKLIDVEFFGRKVRKSGIQFSLDSEQQALLHAAKINTKQGEDGRLDTIIHIPLKDSGQKQMSASTCTPSTESRFVHIPLWGEQVDE